MNPTNHHRHCRRAIVAALTAGTLCFAAAQTTPSKDPPPRPNHPAAKGHKLDHSGQPQVGKASFYARKFEGRKMADGAPFKLDDDNDASKTLPLGTRALVTNLETGQSAVVTIQDRGPYVEGRIVDLSPATAEKIGLKREEGLTTVEVAPIAVPQPDGTMRPGAGADSGVASLSER